MKSDGVVIIKAELQTRLLDKQIADAEEKLEDFQKQKVEIDAEIDANDQTLDVLSTKIQGLKAEKEKLIGGREIIPHDDFLRIEKINEELVSTKKEYDELYAKTEKLANKQSKINSEIDKWNTKLDTAKSKKDALLLKMKTAEIEKVRNSFEEIGKTTGKAIKNVGRWALALIGVRAVYSAINGAVSVLSSENEQLGADIENIRYGLASALLPVIQTVVSWIYKLMSYVNAITKAWFGKEIFSKKNADNLGQANAQAKQLSKTLAGFDEMNTLASQNSDSSGSSGGGNIETEDFTIPDVEIPSWLQWIMDNKDIVIGIFTGIASAIAGIKIVDLLNNLGLLGSKLKGLDLIVKGLGLGLVFLGLSITIKGIIDFLNDPSWGNFLTILAGIALAVAGVAIMFGAWPVAVVAAGVAIVAIIMKYWEQIKSFFIGIGEWLEDKLIVFGYIFSGVINSIVSLFDDLFGGIKQIATGIVQIFKGDFKTGISNVFGGLKKIMLAPINAIISGINTLIRGLNKIKFDVPSWVPVIGGKKLGFNIPQIPKLAQGGIINMPGKGVPIGGYQAIGGEAGQEGVLPLTDSQQMALLGEAIGRYITLNLTNVTQLDGRTIARSTRQVQSNRDFAMNNR